LGALAVLVLSDILSHPILGRAHKGSQGRIAFMLACVWLRIDLAEPRGGGGQH